MRCRLSTVGWIFRDLLYVQNWFYSRHLELTAGLQLLYLDLLQHCNEAFFGGGFFWLFLNLDYTIL